MRSATLLLASALALAASPLLADSREAFWPIEADTDGDDRISRQEAMVLSDKAFAEYDRDGDAAISQTEWRLAIEDQLMTARQRDPGVASPSNMENFVDKTFRTHDGDGDGSISREEWSSRVDAHFGRLDRNGDGMIERSEAGLPQGG